VRNRAVMALATVLVTLVPTFAMAQTDLEQSKNLTTCLSGRYPSLCKKQWLTSEEARKAEAAENQENLKTCLTGRYPALCNMNKLSPEEAQQALNAERQDNLKTCLTGRYKTLCKKHLLTDAQRRDVLAAEESNNLRICLAGSYPSLCDKSLLSREELAQTNTAENHAAEAAKQMQPRQPRQRPSASGCEAHHWIQSVFDSGRLIKLEDDSIWQVNGGDAIYSAL
jgi:hypothetical protein